MLAQDEAWVILDRAHADTTLPQAVAWLLHSREGWAALHVQATASLGVARCVCCTASWTCTMARMLQVM
jgi:hypothetical protein